MAKKRKASTSGGGSNFTQNIVVTPDNVKIETNEKKEIKAEKEDKGIEREE